MKRRSVTLLDVTLMAGDAVCIAGVDDESGETYRLNDPQPTARLIERYDGLRPGDCIDVNLDRIRRLHPPHMEDRRWDPRSVRKRAPASHGELVRIAASASFDGIAQAFGPASDKGFRRNSSWSPDVGARSLAWIRVQRMHFSMDSRSRLRIALQDAAGERWDDVPIQDLSLRTHQVSCDECRDDFLSVVRRDFYAAEPAFARVGLTRPYAAEEGRAPVCWLQVTNVLARPRQHF